MNRNKLLRPDIEIIASDAIPLGTWFVAAPPSRPEEQLMRGMTEAERVLFMSYCGRLALVKNVGSP